MWQDHHERDSNLDAALDKALASYADPNERSSHELTAQILARVERHKTRRRLLYGVAILAPALACLLVVALMPPQHAKPGPHKQSEETANYAPLSTTQPTPPALQPTGVLHSSVSANRAHAALSHHANSLPRLNQFPAPAPPSEQEQLLANFVAQAPPQEQLAVLKAQKQSIQPLHIAELSIPLLEPETHPE